MDRDIEQAGDHGETYREHRDAGGMSDDVLHNVVSKTFGRLQAEKAALMEALSAVTHEYEPTTRRDVELCVQCSYGREITWHRTPRIVLTQVNALQQGEAGE